jgi:hypothetical protein
MAIYASTSTITTQTVPLIIVDPATVQDEYFLIWNSSVGAFVASPFSYTIDLDVDSITGFLDTDKGGTGQTNYSDGDLLVGNNNTLIKLPIGQTEQVLTVENNLPVWKSIDKLNKVKNVINQTFSTNTEFFIEKIPANSQLMNITMYIEEAYDNGAVVAISDNDEFIVENEIINASKQGTYIYSINKEYTEETTIYFNVLNTSINGSAKVFLEYTIL